MVHLLRVDGSEKARGSFLEEGTLALSYNIYKGTNQGREFSRKDGKKYLR